MSKEDQRSDRDHDDTDKTQGRRPEMGAFSVQDTPDGKGYWNRIGAAWAHKDGQGYEIDMQAMPVNGRITLRTLRDQRMESYDAQNAERSKEPPVQEHSRGRSR